MELRERYRTPAAIGVSQQCIVLLRPNQNRVLHKFTFVHRYWGASRFRTKREKRDTRIKGDVSDFVFTSSKSYLKVRS